MADKPKNKAHTGVETTQAATPQPHKLIEDIKPVPTKDRSQLGVVELVLDEGQRIRAVGMVYGLEHHVSGPGYNAHLFLDCYNQRIKVMGYSGEDYLGLMEKLHWLAIQNGFDKILFMAHRHDWQRFLRRGYLLEAVLRYFHEGDDAFVMSKFGSQARLSSENLFQEIQLIEQILDRDLPERVAIRPEGYEFRLARNAEIPELIEMYQDIFESYPSPLIHEDYLQSVFQKENLFAVAVHSGKIVSAASAELMPSHKAAEITDCATRKAARGRGLMSCLLELLENEVRRRGYVCAYTMARARSFGMNNVFYQHRYEFSGRLVNNCDIYGAYEDMNIWVKRL